MIITINLHFVAQRRVGWNQYGSKTNPTCPRGPTQATNYQQTKGDTNRDEGDEHYWRHLLKLYGNNILKTTQQVATVSLISSGLSKNSAVIRTRKEKLGQSTPWYLY